MSSNLIGTHEKKNPFLLCGLSVMSSWRPVKSKGSPPPVVILVDTSLVNTAHLDNLYVPVTFTDGMQPVFLFIRNTRLSPVAAGGEGYTCVDDVSRAALVYLRSGKIFNDTSMQSKPFKLINFIIEMQSSNGYFYNFLIGKSDQYKWTHEYK